MNEDFGDLQKRRPAQHQPRQPGKEQPMQPQPVFIRDDYQGSRKLQGKVALITGGDSGIGRSIAVHFAREGADVAFVFLNEKNDAEKTRQLVEEESRNCLVSQGDVADRQYCRDVVAQTRERFGRLDILVNNAAEQHPAGEFTAISAEQLHATFSTNFFGYFYLAQAAVEHMTRGGAIINTTSITAYRGSAHLIDYASTKGAIVAFTRSLASALVSRGIRVNGVAPGPIWTPLIPGQFRRRGGKDFRRERAYGARRTTRGSRAVLRIPGVGRCLLHDRSGAASQRRRIHFNIRKLRRVHRIPWRRVKRSGDFRINR